MSRTSTLLLALTLLASPVWAAPPTTGTNPTTPVPGTGPVVTAPPATPAQPEVGPAEARIAISSLPFVISTPGSYVLTKNLTGASGRNGIEVNASDVTIDLNGFALGGVAGSLSGIREFPSGGGLLPGAPRENLRVVNGTVRGWGARGIDASAFENVQLAGLRVTRNIGGGVRTGVCASIDGTTVRDNAGIGIEGGDCSTIRSANVEGNTGDGIVVGKGSTVASSSACENERGIVVGAGSTVASSTASRNRGDGVRAEASTLLDLTANENGGNGVQVVDGSNVRGSVANKNGANGFLVADFSAIADSSANTNTAAGIELWIGNSAMRNRVSWNATGIHVTNDGNRVDGNHATNNGCGICTEPAAVSAVVVNNTARSNAEAFGGSAHYGSIKTGPLYNVCLPEQACSVEYAPAWANFDVD